MLEIQLCLATLRERGYKLENNSIERFSKIFLRYNVIKTNNPVAIYLLKFNNRTTRRCWLEHI